MSENRKLFEGQLEDKLNHMLDMLCDGAKYYKVLAVYLRWT